MEGYYDFTVNGYELDSFGHVNNSVYLNYYEQARWILLNNFDLYNKVFLKKKLFLVLTDVSIKFRSELKIFDEAKVHTIMENDGNFIISRQKIRLIKNNKLISSAITKLLFVDQNRLPHNIPDIVQNYINESKNKREGHINAAVR